MKKARNFMLVALVALTVASLYSVAGTYAKYTTSGDASDTARVAKFGVEIGANGDKNVFTSEIEKDGKMLVRSTLNGDNTRDKVVAPGMSGTLAAFTITGKPEVATKVSFTADLKLTGWEIDGESGKETYMPLVFTVNGTPYKMADGTDIDTFMTTVEDAIKEFANNFEFEADTNLAEEFEAQDKKLNISWEWVFEGESTEGAYQTNEKDTKLADLESAPTVELTVTANVDQIKEFGSAAPAA